MPKITYQDFNQLECNDLVINNKIKNKNVKINDGNNYLEIQDNQGKKLFWVNDTGCNIKSIDKAVELEHILDFPTLKDGVLYYNWETLEFQKDISLNNLSVINSSVENLQVDNLEIKNLKLPDALLDKILNINNINIKSLTNEILNTNEHIPWFTPVILSGWMVTHSWTGVALQLGLILINAIVYYPFVLANKHHNITGKALDMLVKRYSAGESIEGQSEQSFARSHSLNQLEQYSLKSVTDALNSGALSLYYQPKIDPKTQDIVGFEALLRLIQADGVVVGPWFLETLEQHNLMYIIDDFVIDQLEVDLSNFAAQGFKPNISFNISPQNLLAGGYKRVVNAFARYPNQVEVEILESSYIEDFEATVKLVNFLNKHHIKCAMDDFGTGYSSMAYLSQLMIDEVKIDRAFVTSIHNNETNQTIVKTLMNMAQALGAHVVIEGIETINELNVLKTFGPSYGQGFYWSPAIDLNKFEQTYLRSQPLTKTALEE